MNYNTNTLIQFKHLGKAFIDEKFQKGNTYDYLLKDGVIYVAVDNLVFTHVKYIEGQWYPAYKEVGEEVINDLQEGEGIPIKITEYFLRYFSYCVLRADGRVKGCFALVQENDNWNVGDYLNKQVTVEAEIIGNGFYPDAILSMVK